MAYGWLIQLAVALVLTVAAELLRPKPKIENARPKGLGDFNFPTATEGRVIPVIFGRVMLESLNVVWYGAFQSAPITKYVKTGLWSGKRITQGFAYKVGIQGALCRGPIDDIHGVWVGDTRVFDGTATWTDSKYDIVYDDPEFFGGEQQGGGLGVTWEIFRGDTTQPSSDYLERYQDAGAGTTRTPRYNGTCYFVARAADGTSDTAEGAYIGNQASLKPWKFEVSRFSGLIPGQTAGQNKIGTDDCNPINVLYELLTNTEWGLSFTSAEVDTAGFVTAAATCNTEGIGFSMVVDNGITAADFMQEIERHIDGVVYIDKTSGLWRVKLARNDYTLANVPSLTVDNVLEVVNFDQGSWSETVNRVDVKFNHRDNDYKESFATSSDAANYLTQGGGTLSTGVHSTSEVAYPGVKIPAVAAQLAWRDLRSLSYPLAKAQFKVTREFWDLNLGDVIKWTDDRFGYDELVMRITKLDYGDLAKNVITVNAIQDVFEYVDASFGNPPASNWTDAFATPVDYDAIDYFFEEAPRKIVELNPTFTSHDYARFMYACNFSGEEAKFRVFDNGALLDESTDFMAVGKLQKAIDVLGDPGQPTNSDATATITVSADPSSITRLKEFFLPDSGVATDADQGQNLQHLVRIGSVGDEPEFLTCDSVSEVGGNLVLSGPNRGILDSVQREWPINTEVSVLMGGISLLDGEYALSGDTIGSQFRMVTYRGDEYAGSVTTNNRTTDKRAIRPYPPAGVLYNGDTVAYATDPDFLDAGSNYNDYELNLDARRRDYLNTDEVTALTTDDTGVDASTEYQLQLVADPDSLNLGAANVVNTAWQTSNTFTGVLLRFYLNVAAAGDECETRINTRHDIGSETNLEAKSKLIHRFTPVTDFDGTFHMGASVAISPGFTNTYTAASTGTHTFYSTTAVSSGQVRYSVNGGGYVLGMSSGTSFTVALNAGDTINFTRTANYGNTVIYLEDGSSTKVAHGTFRN